MYLGAVVPLVIAGVAGGWCHPLAQSTAHAAVGAPEPAPVLGQVSTVVPVVSTGVGGMGCHPGTQATALGTRLSMGLAVGLGQLGTVAVLVNAGLGRGQRSISGSRDLHAI